MDFKPIFLADEGATERLATEFASVLAAPLIVYLNGDLGAGKTCFTRAVVRALGYHGPVKSPTFTLVESYTLPVFSLYHFDLYRLSDPEELEYLGLRDYVEENSVIFVEWPDKGRGFLPAADLDIQISQKKGGRELTFIANSTRAAAIMRRLTAVTGG